MHPVRSHREGGLTLIEVIVVLAVLVILAGLLIPSRGRPGAKSNRIACVNNLKNIGLGMRVFANDHGGAFPMILPAAQGGTLGLTDDASRLWQQFAALTNQLTSPRLLWCPSDAQRKPATTFGADPASRRAVVFSGNRNLSYFLGLNAREDLPESILAGDRNLTNETGDLSPGRHVLADGSKLGFNSEIHQNAGNVLLGDGSVQQLTTGRLREQFHTALTNSGLLTNVWLVP